MKNYVALIFLTLTLTPLSLPADNKKLSVNETMSQIGLIMSEMYPELMVDSAKVNPGMIATNVNRLIFLLKSAKPHFKKKSAAALVSYDVMIRHLTETHKAVNDNNMQYAKGLLKEITAICTSCHTQDNKQQTLFKGPKRQAFQSDFQYAEFNFLTRNYGHAIRFYDKFLNKPKRDSKNTNTALKRLLTIYVQIYNEPQKAEQRFLQYQKNLKLTRLEQKNLAQWIQGLQQLNKNKVGLDSITQIQAQVDKYLGPLKRPGNALISSKSQKIFHLWLQGRLYKYLNSPSLSKDEIPKLLYWLALNARATNYSYYFSLADLYLKECMVSHKQHAYAKNCFEEYKEALEFNYSGSLGTHIPAEQLKELERLRALVYP